MPASSSPLRTISAVAFGSVISSGIERTSTPSMVACVALVDQPAVEDADAGARAEVRADGLGGGLDADHRQAFIGHPAQRLSGDDGGVADDRRRRRAQRATDSGHGEDRADAHHRIGRREQHDVGVGDRLGDTGARGGLVGADESEAVGGDLGAVAHPPLLEVDRPLGVGLVVRIRESVRHDDVGFAAVVGDGQQSGARLPPRAQRLGDLRQRIARAQHLAAHQMRGQVPVAEAEPVRLHAVGGEFFLRVPGFVRVAPAPFGVDTST